MNPVENASQCSQSHGRQCPASGRIVGIPIGPWVKRNPWSRPLT